MYKIYKLLTIITGYCNIPDILFAQTPNLCHNWSRWLIPTIPTKKNDLKFFGCS